MSNTEEGKRQKAKGKSGSESAAPSLTVERFMNQANRNRVIRTSWKTMPRNKARSLSFAFCLFTFTFLVSGCRQDMHDQPKYKFGRESAFFPDQRASRPLVEGTVARGQLRDDKLFYTGKTDAAAAAPAQTTSSTGAQPATSFPGYATTFPFAIDEAALNRGQERYNIYCSVCHGLTGEGDGMVVNRGYRKPPSYHQDRLRQAPAGYLFDVVTNGFGAMPDYAQQISPEDRWKIVAYIRALQVSQQGTPAAELTPDQRNRLNQAATNEGEQRQGEHK